MRGRDRESHSQPQDRSRRAQICQLFRAKAQQAGLRGEKARENQQIQQEEEEGEFFSFLRAV